MLGSLPRGDLDHTDVDGDNNDDVWDVVAAGTDSDNMFGTIAVGADGQWTYTLDEANLTVNALDTGDTLTDSFTATTEDGTTQVVNITIQGANDAPEAIADPDMTGENSDLTVDVLANDTDVDGDDSPANFSLDAVGTPMVTGLSGSGTGSVSIDTNQNLV